MLRNVGGRPSSGRAARICPRRSAKDCWQRDADAAQTAAEAVRRQEAIEARQALDVVPQLEAINSAHPGSPDGRRRGLDPGTGLARDHRHPLQIELQANLAGSMDDSPEVAATPSPTAPRFARRRWHDLKPHPQANLALAAALARRRFDGHGGLRWRPGHGARPRAGWRAPSASRTGRWQEDVLRSTAPRFCSTAAGKAANPASPACWPCIPRSTTRSLVLLPSPSPAAIGELSRSATASTARSAVRCRRTKQR